MDNDATTNSSHVSKIVVARVLGFCYGVKRAVDITLAERSARMGEITSLGPIVHNGSVVEELGRLGIQTVGDVDQVRSGAVVLSAHGVSPALRERIRERHLEMIDTTCPFVTRVHAAALKFVKQGRHVVLVGDPGHTEVAGVIGSINAAGGTATVVMHVEDLAGLDLPTRIGVVSQTTHYAHIVQEVVAALQMQGLDVAAVSTVCGATEELQDAAKDLAVQVDVVVVVGGTQSANTRRLRELCEAEGKQAYQVTGPEEVDLEWFGKDTIVGLTAGASTPDSLIEAVARKINGGNLPLDWVLNHPEDCRQRPGAKLAGACEDRTHQGRLNRPTHGFEDREGHQAPFAPRYAGRNTIPQREDKPQIRTQYPAQI